MMDGVEMSAGYNANRHLSLNIVAEMKGQMALMVQDEKTKSSPTNTLSLASAPK